jgi:hypothetical protein
VTIGGIKEMGTHKRSENGRGAWVASFAQRFLADTDEAN